MAMLDFNTPGGLLNLNPSNTGSLGINLSPINEQKKIDEQKRKRAEESKKLQDFADLLRMINANQSGNAQEAAMFSNRMAQRKAEQEARQLKAQQDMQRRNIYNNAPENIQIMMDYADANVSPAIINSLANASKDNRTAVERSRDRLVELNNNKNRTSQEEYEMNLLKTSIYGEKEVIPFFDSNGNPLNKIITSWDLIDNPALVGNLVNQGFVTVGSSPSGSFNAPTNANDEISQKWQDTTNTLDLINKLSVVLDEGRDSPTVAGAIADLVNTGIYQVKSANKLLSFQENYPKEYSEKVNYIQNKHGNVLNKISADRGIATSTVMRLAYSLAKTADPGGRLSDKDIDSAILVIGGSGANVDKRLSVLGSLHSSLSGEYETYLETQRRKYPGNKSIQGTISRFTDLPTFGYSPAPVSQVGKYQIEPVN